MADTTYRVVLSLSTEGNLGARLGDVSSKLESAQGHTQRFQHGLVMAGEVGSRALEHVGHFLESVADKIIHVGEAGAALTLGGIFAGAAYGVTHLNDQLEQTEISLGAIFHAQGFADNFNDAFKMGGEQIAKMKQDVKTLPGDLGQLSAIMSSIATPAAMGGMGPDQIRQLAGQSMLVGRIVLGAQADNAMIAREMANLLSGRAGAHNIMGLRLGLAGDAAKHFNALAPEQRVKEIEQIFERYKGANDKFAQSFVANWTTLKDNIKYGFLAEATAPVFEAVKHTIVLANTWFDEHKGKTMAWANSFGAHLTHAWNAGISVVERMGPVLENLGTRFFELWDRGLAKAKELGPLFDKIAGILSNVNAEDLMKAAKAVLELKLAGGAISGLGGVASMGFTAMRAASLMERMGPSAGAGLSAGGSLGALVGGAALPVTVLTFGAAAAATLTAFGEARALADPASPSHNDAVIAAKNLAKGLADVTKAATPAVSLFDKMGVAITNFTGVVLQGIGQFFQGYRALPHPGGYVDRPDDRSNYLPTGQNMGAVADMGLARIGEGGNKFWDNVNNAIKSGEHKKLPGGGGGTNIQKVEIVVRGSGDPSRVARLVKTELEALARNPTRSPHVPNWAAARP